MTFSCVTTDGALNAPINSVRTTSFSGSYAANKVRVSGTLVSGGGLSWPWDSRIMITTPGGVPFTVQPFTQEGEFTSLSTNGDMVFDVPNPGAAAGVWTFRFYEYYDDDGVDATWSPITITLDNDPPPTPVVLSAVGGVYSEVEGSGNDRKLTANIIPAITDGQSISGSTQGISTTVAGPASADYFRIKTAAAPPAIYKHRLALTSPTPGQAVTLRGLAQVDGVITQGSDVGFQFGLPFTSPAQVAQWYGFGKQEEVYYAVTGDSTTTGPYTSTYSREAVTPIEAGSYYSGRITIDRAPSDTVDTDFIVYDSALTPIRGYMNDEPNSLSRVFSPGVYYLAFSNWNIANDQPSPPDDTERGENVLDFPNAIANSSAQSVTDLSVRFTDPTLQPISIPAIKAGMYDITWFRFTVVPNTVNTSPSGLGAATPTHVYQTRPVLVTVNVAAGQNPSSSGVSVNADLSQLGLSSSQQLYDDGTHGDQVAGDGTFSDLAIVSPSTSTQALSLPFTVSDSQGRSSIGTLSVTILPAPQPNQFDEAFSLGDAPSLPADATPIDGAGPLNYITGRLTQADVDLYRINICSPSQFSASTYNPYTNMDTQLFLFDSSGRGVTTDDDDPSGTAYMSTISGQFVHAPGIYYLAVTEWDKDPLDASHNYLWQDSVNGNFAIEHAADGPGAANPVNYWDYTVGAGGPYMITLSGVCRGEPVGGGCGSADFNCDGDVATDADIEAFFACLAGNCPGAPCNASADFNGDGDVATDADIEAFFRVLAGGSC